MSYPTDAEVRATGTTINGRQIEVSVASALALGASIFVTVIPYSASDAGGFEGSSMKLKGTRHDASATKTVLWTVGVVTFGETTGLQMHLSKVSGIVTMRRDATITLLRTAIGWADLQVPQGVTITNISFDVYEDASVASDLTTLVAGLQTVDSSGTATLVASTADTAATGWQTLSATLSHSTTGAHYRLFANFQTDSDADVDNQRLKWARFYITYTMPTTAASL